MPMLRIDLSFVYLFLPIIFLPNHSAITVFNSALLCDPHLAQQESILVSRFAD